MSASATYKAALRGFLILRGGLLDDFGVSF